MTPITLTRREFVAGAATGVFAAQNPQPQAPPARRTGLSELPPGDFLKPEQAPGDLANKRWRLRYEFRLPQMQKEAVVESRLGGITFSTERYGMAWLTTVEQARIGDPRVSFGDGYAVITRDGGTTWTPQKVSGYPIHVFALDEARCWMLTTKGLFFSNEFGADWEKRRTPTKRLARIHFLDEKHGYAFGVGKVFWHTSDGGRKWNKVPESEQLEIKSQNTWLAAMSFLNRKEGLLVGGSRPERGDMTSYLDTLPTWMVPERATRKRELPSSLFAFETRDGGATWKSSVVSSFGAVSELRLRREMGFAILSFGESIEWPTEVIRLNLKSGNNEAVFRKRKYSVTDFAILDNGGLVLAGIEHTGRLRDSGIAGRMKVFWSNDLKQWVDMRVHYSAEGDRIMLARVSDNIVWAATDQGQILQLAE